MKKLIIKNINKFKFTLEDENYNIYNFNIEFIDINIPKTGDIIYMNDILFQEINNIFVSFGPINSVYGKEIEKSSDKDLIILQVDNKKIYLKRLYG